MIYLHNHTDIIILSKH